MRHSSRAKSLLHVAQATEVCGMLFELLQDEGARKNATRKGCVALLKQADLYHLEMPNAVRERADVCVRMGLVALCLKMAVLAWWFDQLLKISPQHYIALVSGSETEKRAARSKSHRCMLPRHGLKLGTSSQVAFCQLERWQWRCEFQHACAGPSLGVWAPNPKMEHWQRLGWLKKRFVNVCCQGLSKVTCRIRAKFLGVSPV